MTYGDDGFAGSVSDYEKEAKEAGVDGGGGGGIHPKGVFKFKIERSEVKPTKAGDGKYLNIAFKSSEGWHFERFCFDHPSKKTQAIAKRQIADMATAIGLTTWGSASAFLGESLNIEIGHKPGGNMGVEATIRKFIPLSDEEKAGVGGPAPVGGDSEDIPF